MNVKLIAEALRMLARGLEEDVPGLSLESAAPVQATPRPKLTAAEADAIALRAMKKAGIVPFRG